ncbi:Translation initiation factor eIF2B subunit epsilon [Plasmodiophora brassicae]|uniref:Translation initiation factor eIF2B subunit epsilon n=1 Tax=Plasmodiophora brassicae TaxID=37360 RepID=A0A0G4IVP5_PLABS|nr:hypothetical protein PBRA_001218 [Plasmodiophora brassicae]
MASRKPSAVRSDLKVEVPLQAIVLADSFERRFSPLTWTQPKALLPLVNTPIINYTLRFLARSGVGEAFVVVRAFAAELKEYCSELRPAFPSMRVTVVMVNESCSSIGDVLRHVGQLEIIRSETFILIGADTVADVDMKPVIADHQSRAAADPNAVMTVVLKPAVRKHRIRPDGDNLFVAISPVTMQLLAYANGHLHSRLPVDVDIMIDNAAATFHTNLFDTFIYICSTAVLDLFADQFDMQNIEHDLFAQVLGSSSILGYSVFAHIVPDRYAARVNGVKTYDAVSRDIIERWAFRFAVDNGCDSHCASYSSQRMNIFKEVGEGALSPPRIAQSAVITRNTVIGAGSVVSACARVTDSVLGRNVTIGNDAVCTGSYLWDGATVGARSVLDRVIVARNVQIGSDCNIGQGVMLADGVRIGNGVRVPPYTRIWIPTRKSGASDEFDGDEDGDELSTPLDLGPDGLGVVYRGDSEDFEVELEDGEEEGLDAGGRRTMKLARITSNTLSPDYDALAFREAHFARIDQDEDGDSVLTFSDGEGVHDTESEVEAMAESDWDEDSYNISRLYGEIRATIERCIDQKISNKNDILLEVANLKIADNASLTNYAASVFLSLFDQIDGMDTDVPMSRPTKAVLSSLSRLLREWNFLLEKYGQGLDENHVMFVKGLQKACTYDGKPYRCLFAFALQGLYQLDAISGDAILSWAEEPDQDEQLLAAAGPLIDHLQEEDEESDDDEKSD